MRSTYTSRVVAVLFAFALASAMDAPGFGRLKKTIELQRKLPAAVQLPGDRFDVAVTASDAKNQAAAAKLKTIIETEMASFNSKLVLDPKKPDTDITITILDMDVPQPTPITATTSPTNPFSKKKSNAQTKTIGYKYTGHVEVAYQAKTPSGGFVDAGNIKTSYAEQTNTASSQTEDLKKSFDKWKHLGRSSDSDTDDQAQSPKTVADVQELLLKKLTALVAARLVNTNETVQVDLAKGGPLDDALKYADAKQWSKMAEALETMTPLSDQHQDAYRLYDLGVAYEALGYSAETPAGAKRNLEEAAADYGKAADMNPAEKDFLQPQNRIEIALEHYKKLNTPETAKAGNGAAQ